MRNTARLAAMLLVSLITATAGHARSAYAPDKENLAVATFAGGCFWCVEEGFEKIPGVVEAVSGYSGGKETNPSYEQVSACLLYTSPSPRD